MALRITDLDGVDLVAQPPEITQISAVSLSGARTEVQCQIIEEGTLPFSFVSGTLDWNDGSQAEIFNGTSAGTLVVNEFRVLPPGDYTVSLFAHNFAAPAWEMLRVNFPFEVRVSSAVTPGSPLLFGPILPKDAGYPNPSQWNWNRGQDLEILASSVKMLLTTAKGERIQQPEYGTNLQRILFEPQTSGVEGLVQQEIVDAITRWEPRVELQFLNVERTAAREVTVYATFVSRLTQENFLLPLAYVA